MLMEQTEEKTEEKDGKHRRFHREGARVRMCVQKKTTSCYVCGTVAEMITQTRPVLLVSLLGASATSVRGPLPED